MSDSRFNELIKMKITGERVRVLFELLMDILEAAPNIERVQFWEKIKNAYEGEAKAMEEMMKSPNRVKVRGKRKSKVLPESEPNWEAESETDDIRVS